ncbi:GH92 family glycosyl hydrolase [Belliella sp. DSM 111904]|uniref:GH92 family glycosyl hydrolase n=1 Tax=Belliella filtrata TaxID=2923435 RepID=A0ABS9UWG8_9BACT|nr:GH92 family glycosyl hydrolase [Belliella filtrata]MCH7408517.1 GH92 family glycosyl hydrolase [Belliella filtrata]
MNIKSLHIIGLVVLCISFQSFAQETKPIDHVNILMGTDSKPSLSNGNTYPAIALPWGMNFWMPQTGNMGSGWAYTYTADKIKGFKQTHQPSPWMNDYGQFSIMPMTGKPIFDEEERASWFSHKSEIAKPHYYSVYLADHDIITEITPTERAARFRFTFPKTDSAYVVIDGFDKGSYIKIIPDEQKIIGYTTKNSGGVPDNFKNYFVISFDQPFEGSGIWNNGAFDFNSDEIASDHAGAVVRFKSAQRGQQLNAKVASSFISFDQALLNLEEIGNRDFESVRQSGEEIWNRELGRINVSGGSIDQIRTFYSCLYRTLLFPRKFYEIDESGNVMHYSPYNGEVLSGFMFTDTGFWDTFRSLFPFLNLMYPSLNAQIQEGLVNAYKEGGWLPEWASPGYRDIMVGNNSASVVADAYLKGGSGYDINTLYEAVLKGAENEGPLRAVARAGASYYTDLGYVPYDVGIHESAARSLEYAYDDFAIYQLAKKLNRPKDEIEKFALRSQNYRHLFDSESGLMRGKNKNGDFQSPFNPFKWGDAFTEGNSWHYTWSVFHDIAGLIDLMGGHDRFISQLDTVFSLPPIFDESYYNSVIHEIREMQIANMGQYAHGNQPIQHMIYLYNYAGEPWKSQFWVRETMDRMYSPIPDGYCGDEDNGQTSAWYVFSAMGFYPVCPATDEYIIGAPLFEKINLTLENGKKIEIEAKNNSRQNKYIQSMKVNGKKYSKNWLSHDALMKGTKIKFTMNDVPNKERGISESDFPYSISKELDLIQNDKTTKN